VVVWLLQPATCRQIAAAFGSDAPIVLAAPWRLLVGTACSFAVCCAGRPRARPATGTAGAAA
jgi:hypothetical protein